MREREQTERPLGLEERRQRREGVAALERRPEATWLYRKNATIDGATPIASKAHAPPPDPAAAPWDVAASDLHRLVNASWLEQQGVERHRKRERRPAQERGAGQQPDEPGTLPPEELDEAREREDGRDEVAGVPHPAPRGDPQDLGREPEQDGQPESIDQPLDPDRGRATTSTSRRQPRRGPR